MRFFEIRPKSCGHKHWSARGLLRCLAANGVPGFEVIPIDVTIETSQSPRGPRGAS